MADFMETEDKRSVIKEKLRQQFDGKIVRKDLTKKIKEGANVPVYVLEFLLGQYCSSDDPEVVEDGVNNVKRILADNFVRPDEAQKILSILRQRGSYTVIDKITVNLNIKRDYYEAEFSNLGLKDIPIDEEYPAKFDRLLCGGIWCIVQLDYEYMEEDRNGTPIRIRKLTPIQMPLLGEFMDGFKEFQGKNLDAAIQEACSYYNAAREKLEIEIVQDAKSGIFGIVGARKAKIRARRAALREAVESVLGKKRCDVRLERPSLGREEAPRRPAEKVSPAAREESVAAPAAPAPEEAFSSFSIT